MAMRSIDFWAMNVFPSKGFNTVAVEIKVSRADFFRETSNPRKRESAEEVARECFFAVPKGLVSKDEVPKGWGLIEVNDGNARTTLKAQQGPRPVYDETFIASVLRRACERERAIRAQEIVIDGAAVAAADLEKWLVAKSGERYARDKETLEKTWKQECIKQLLGEGLQNVESRLRDEFGWNSPLSFAEKVVEIVDRAQRLQLAKLRDVYFDDKFREAVRNVVVLADQLGITDKSGANP